MNRCSRLVSFVTASALAAACSVPAFELTRAAPDCAGGSCSTANVGAASAAPTGAAVSSSSVGASRSDAAGASAERATSAGGPMVGLAGKCLAAGSPVVIADCDGSPGQRWTLTEGAIVGDDGKCLDVAGGKSADGTPIGLADCTGAPSQAWSRSGAALVGLGGRCLDVVGGGAKTASGTAVELWDCTGWENQRWSLGAGAGALPLDGGTPSSGVLPSKVLTTYYWPFDGGQPSIDAIRTTDGASKYNVLSYVSAMGDGSGSGRVVLNGAPIDGLAGQVASWKASGRVAILMVSHVQNLRLTSPGEVTDFVSSISVLIDAYGFQGIDWDMEDSGTQSNQESIVSATQQLKDLFGPSFVVSVVPRYYEVRTGGSMLWSSIMKAMLPLIDIIAFQEYDNAVYADPSFAQIAADYADAIAQGFPANKLALGTSTFSGVSVSGGAASPSTYASAFRSLAASYPGFRGAVVWQSGSDAHDAPSWSYASALSSAIGL